MTAATLFAASREMAVITSELWHAFEAFDVILSPVLADGPPPVGVFDFNATSIDAHLAQMQAIAPNAALANVAGAAALAIPHGMDDRRVPVGIQLMSRCGTDLALLELAAQLVEALPDPSFPFPIAGHP
jgi:amidase